MDASHMNSIISIKKGHSNEPDYKLMEYLGIPYLEVNNQLYIVKCHDSVLESLRLEENNVVHKSLTEMELSHPIFSAMKTATKKVLMSGERVTVECELEENLYSVKALPYSMDRVIICIEDKSLQKQFQNLLTFHHQMEAVSHIAAGVAHELRNPLSVIKGFMQLSNLTNDYEKYYSTILSELDRMNAIIEDFLSVSKKKSGRNIHSPLDIMQSLVEIMKSECLLHNVHLSYQFIESEVKVLVNESMIKQVMLNLLRNAIEAFEQEHVERRLHIQTTLNNEYYTISVEDNGKGIPEDVLAQIGRPFFTTKKSGTGIGVALCKKIVEDHGGSFQIKSTYNVGTTVTITIPTHMERESQ
ncbi:nitrogen regulation protein NR(II) [Halalkalibacter sp. APA_J-10(15)]|uniref:two-component system sensor histidine kinase NtrB n=1 Tax=Halalkalibacter sp. APA_J-10(15) TaxID=2933805 RepID=UPI001FF16303|nr:HAMP domain-containing sensor histidine kinase [Halalkalibacter sp. APA_J-10(15)]MCK0471542.1 HAMP domain-containing histidine kinase [Halalkalibacter sp. APA_J-10(15)]